MEINLNFKNTIWKFGIYKPQGLQQKGKFETIIKLKGIIHEKGTLNSKATSERNEKGALPWSKKVTPVGLIELVCRISSRCSRSSLSKGWLCFTESSAWPSSWLCLYRNISVCFVRTHRCILWNKGVHELITLWCR